MASTASPPFAGTVLEPHTADPYPDELHGDGLGRPVALVRWPEQTDRRAQLAAAFQPRLLLLSPGTPPPLTWDDGEDWVRLPADDDEIRARALHLVRHGTFAAPVPIVDTDGIVRTASGLVAVSPLEAKILAVLLHRAGQAVDSATLVRAGWPNGNGDVRPLAGRIRTLRLRLAPLGIRIETVRSIGYLLDVG